MKNILILGSLLVSSALAQVTTLPVDMPRPQPSYAELQQYLTLTDQQISALEQIQQTRFNAEQAIHEQMQSRYTQLNRLLEAGSTDSATIGRLMVEINNLRRQLPLDPAPYRQPALNVLNETQRAKLPALAQAIQLSSPAYQAVNLNLVDAPVPDVRILPMPAPAGATVTSEFRAKP